jgi:hypothetical protein
MPDALSFLAYGTFQSFVHGLDENPIEDWPDNSEFLLVSGVPLRIADPNVAAGRKINPPAFTFPTATVQGV